ncbi:MAG TPA: entericidin A/B family lipoprotein [Chromatiales bacterium]|nr:entericidin A/B family lipoprotein [Chromatiales bacterium]
MKAAAILVVAALFLSACNTFEGIGKDIKKGGEAIERAAN